MTSTARRRDDLSDRVALVSGGTQASGAAIGHALAVRGATVLVAGRDREAGAAIAAEIEATGASTGFVHLDLTDEAAVDAAVASVKREHGSVDIVVNNAAAVDHLRSGGDVPVGQVSTDVFHHFMLVGLYGPLWLYRAAIGGMVERGRGVFVNVSSLAAASAIPASPAYSASKAALEALSRQVCADYGQHGIRSNVIRLGRMVVPANANFYNTGANRRDALSTLMTTELATPVDLASAVAFLASDDSRFINGSVVEVDGGASHFRPGPTPRLSPGLPPQ